MRSTASVSDTPPDGLTHQRKQTANSIATAIAEFNQFNGWCAYCDNTSRPGFRVDPPFAWETAHEAYFGAVASAQDLLEVTPVSPANLEETGSDLPYGRPG